MKKWREDRRSIYLSFWKVWAMLHSDIQSTLNALSASSEHENVSCPTAEEKVRSKLSCPSLRLTS